MRNTMYNVKYVERGYYRMIAPTDQESVEQSVGQASVLLLPATRGTLVEARAS